MELINHLEKEIKDFYQPDGNIKNDEGLEFKYSIEIMNYVK